MDSLYLRDGLYKWNAGNQDALYKRDGLYTNMILPEVLLCVWTLEDSMSYAGLWMGSRNCVRKQ